METRSQQETETRAGSGAMNPPDTQAPPWLQRSSLVVLVLTCIYLGLLLFFLPWSPYWKDNHLLAYLPERVAEWLATGAARGLVSGLGLLDIWIGVSEAIHWRRPRGGGVTKA